MRFFWFFGIAISQLLFASHNLDGILETSAVMKQNVFFMNVEMLVLFLSEKVGQNLASMCSLSGEFLSIWKKRDSIVLSPFFTVNNFRHFDI